MARFAVGLSLVLFVASVASGQTDPAAGVQMFSTREYNVDLATSSITLSIPIRGKAGKIPVSFNLIGNYHVFPETIGSLHELTITPTLSPQLSAGDYGYHVISTKHVITTCQGLQNDYVYQNYVVIDPSGAQHPLPTTVMTDQDGCDSWPSTPPVTTDGSGLTVPSTTLVYDKAGNSYSGYLTNGSLTDPDGATISSSVNGNTTTYTDSLGQTFLTATVYSHPGYGTSDTYVYTDASGNSQQYTVAYTAYTLRSNFGCQGLGLTYVDYYNSSSAEYLPTTITSPTGAVTTLTYEVTTGFSPPPPPPPFGSQYTTGRIASITYGSGGSTTYAYGQNGDSYGTNGFDCSTFVVPKVTVTVSDNNGNNGAYTYVNADSGGSSGNSFAVTKTDAAGNQTVYSFAGEFQTQAVAYQGTSTVLSTKIICYGVNGSTPPSQSNCPTPSTIPKYPITETDAYTSLGTSPYFNEVLTKFDATYGNVTAALFYDFGGTLLSQTYNVYGQSYNSPTACNPYASGTYIFGTPCYSHTENSSGTDLSKTKIGYSSTGHPTSTSRWVSGSSWLTSSATFGTNGALTSVTDVNSAVTSYSNFACNGMLPQTTTLPTVNVAMSTSATYDCNGGVKLTNTDVNGNVTTTNYTANGADPLYRPKSVTHPDGGVVSYSYSTGSTNPWTTTTSTALSSGGATISSTATLDGLGRTVSTQSTDPNASSGYKYGATVFNNLGQVLKVYNPYFTTSDQTYGYRSYIYDALGRVTSTTAPDRSSTSTVVYANRAMLFTDASGIQRSAQVDGLGRTVITCAGIGAGPQANNLYGYGAPYSCGMDVTGTNGNGNGFPATNTYDALGNLTTLSYSGQVRSFTYDGLSRMTTESVPEVPCVSCGTNPYSKGYTYDTVTAGDLYAITFLNPSGTSVNAIYSWDKLHRLSTLEYSDSSNGYGYSYDASTWLTWNLSNGKGRLTSQSHSNGAAAAYSYDVMGRPVWEGSCAGTNCYGTVRGINHGYDYAGNVTAITTTWTNGPFTNVRNSLGQITSVTSSWNDGTHPPTLLSGGTYNALGQLAQATYGDGIVRNEAYDKLGRVTEIQDGPSNSPTYRLYLGYYADGSVSSYQDNVTGRWNYTYDAFNRLATAVLTQTGNNSPPNYSYSYDQFGNRWQQHKVSGTGFEVDYTFDTLAPYTTPSHNYNSYFTYDSAGNITTDGVCSGNPCWTFDYAGHLTAGEGASYLYDAQGRRQQKTDVAGTVHSFVFDGDRPFTEFTPSFARQTGGFYTYANGTTYFNRIDNLGTPRLSTDYTGTVARTEGVLMGPYGDNFTETLSTLDFTGFAGGFWDSENNGDHFGAREYQTTHGSWLSPDPAGLKAMDLGDPQTWNRYAYVTNNPVSLIDPTGLYLASPWSGGPCFMCSGPGDGGGWFGNCTVDGASGFCSALELLELVACPGNDCGRGSTTPFQCIGSVCAYMSNEFASTHENEWNGILYSHSQWQVFQNDRADAQRQALADAISYASSSPDGSNWDYIYNHLQPYDSDGKLQIKGGNVDFSWTGDPRALDFISASAWATGGCELTCRYGSMGQIHYDDNLLHLDMASPLWGFGLGALFHLDDVVFGNINPSVPGVP